MAAVPQWPHEKILILNGRTSTCWVPANPPPGSTTLADVEAQCKAEGERLGYAVDCFQSSRKVH